LLSDEVRHFQAFADADHASASQTVETSLLRHEPMVTSSIKEPIWTLSIHGPMQVIHKLLRILGLRVLFQNLVLTGEALKIVKITNSLLGNTNGNI